MPYHDASDYKSSILCRCPVYCTIAVVVCEFAYDSSLLSRDSGIPVNVGGDCISRGRQTPDASTANRIERIGTRGSCFLNRNVRTGVNMASINAEAAPTEI